MRPRKRVLLYCSDETRLGMVRFALLTRPYAVSAAGQLDEALSLARSEEFYAVLVMEPQWSKRCERAVIALWAALPHVPLLLAVHSGPAPATVATVVQIGFDMAVLFDRLRVLCARPRGPKKRAVGIGLEVQAVGRAG